MRSSPVRRSPGSSCTAHSARRSRWPGWSTTSTSSPSLWPSWRGSRARRNLRLLQPRHRQRRHPATPVCLISSLLRDQLVHTLHLLTPRWSDQDWLAMKSIKAVIVYESVACILWQRRQASQVYKKIKVWTQEDHELKPTIRAGKKYKKVIHHSYQPFASIAIPKVPTKLRPASPHHNFLQALNAIQSFAARALYPVVPDSGLPVWRKAVSIFR